MTTEERINYLIEQVKELHDEPKVLCEDDIYGITECLEKQIPRKPSKYIDMFTMYKCKCREEVFPHHNYCPRCGQAIYWGVNE